MKEEMEEQINRETHQRCRFAADTAKIVDDDVYSEDVQAYVGWSLCGT